MKYLILLAAAASLGAQNIAGTFIYPNGAAVDGTLTAELLQPSVRNVCAGGAVTVFRPVVTAITAGNLGTLQLTATTCLAQGTVNPVTFAATRIAGQGAVTTVSQASRFVSLKAGDGSGTGVAANLTTALSGSLNTCMIVPLNSAAQALALVRMANGSPVITYSWNGRAVAFRVAVPLVSGREYDWNFYCGQPYRVTVRDQAGRTLYTTRWVVPPNSGVDVTLADITQAYMTNGARLILSGATGAWNSYTLIWSAI